MQARQLMAPAAKCLDASDSVMLAARRMRALGVTSVPVCEPGNSYVGMVSEHDIVERCVAAGDDPGRTTVGSIVIRPQPSIEARCLADSTVLGLVLRQPLGILAVVDDGVLVGVITLAGIADHLIGDVAGGDVAGGDFDGDDFDGDDFGRDDTDDLPDDNQPDSADQVDARDDIARAMEQSWWPPASR